MLPKRRLFFLFPILIANLLATIGGMIPPKKMRTGDPMLQQLQDNSHLYNFSLVELSWLVRKLLVLDWDKLEEERPFTDIFSEINVQLDDIGVEEEKRLALILGEMTEKMTKVIGYLEEILKKAEHSQLNHFELESLGNHPEPVEMPFLKERARKLVHLLKGHTAVQGFVQQAFGIALPENGIPDMVLDGLIEGLDAQKRQLLLENCVKLTESEKNGFIFINLLALARLLIRQFLAARVNGGQSLVGHINASLRMRSADDYIGQKIAVSHYVFTYDQFEMNWNLWHRELAPLEMFQAQVVVGEDTYGSALAASLEEAERRMGQKWHFYNEPHRHVENKVNQAIWFIRESASNHGGRHRLTEAEQLMLRDTFKENINFQEFFHAEQLLDPNNQHLSLKLLDELVDQALVEEMATLPVDYNPEMTEFTRISNPLVQAMVPSQFHIHTMAKVWEYIKGNGPVNLAAKPPVPPSLVADENDSHDPNAFLASFDQEDLFLLVRLLERVQLEGELKGEGGIRDVLVASLYAVIVPSDQSVMSDNMKRKWTSMVEKLKNIIGHLEEAVIGKAESKRREAFEQDLADNGPIGLELVESRLTGLATFLGPDKFQAFVNKKLGKIEWEANEEEEEGEEEASLIERLMKHLISEPRNRRLEKRQQLRHICLTLTTAEQNFLIFQHFLAMARWLIGHFLTFHKKNGKKLRSYLQLANAKLAAKNGPNQRERISTLQLMEDFDRFEVVWAQMGWQIGHLRSFLPTPPASADEQNSASASFSSSQNSSAEAGLLLKPLLVVEREMASIVHFHLGQTRPAKRDLHIWPIYRPVHAWGFPEEAWPTLAICARKYANFYEIYHSQEMRGKLRWREQLEYLVVEAGFVEELRTGELMRRRGEVGEQFGDFSQVHYKDGAIYRRMPPQAHLGLVQKLRSEVVFRPRGTRPVHPPVPVQIGEKRPREH